MFQIYPPIHDVECLDVLLVRSGRTRLEGYLENVACKISFAQPHGNLSTMKDESHDITEDNVAASGAAAHRTCEERRYCIQL